MRIPAFARSFVGETDRAWLAIYGTAFFALAIEGVAGFLIPMYLVQLQAPAPVLGALVSLAALGPLLMSLPAGALCDRFGDRRVLAVCALGSLLTSVLYPLVSIFWLLGMLQFLGGTTRSVGWLASQSYIARRGAAPQNMGLFTFSANLGMLLAPPLVGVLVSAFDARAAFVVLAAWSVALLVVAWRLPEPQRAAAAPVKNLWRAAYRPFITGFRMSLRPAVAAVLGASFLRLATVAVSQSFYPVYLTQVGFSPATIGMLFSVMFVSSTVASPLVGVLARFISTGRLLWVATLLSIGGITLITAFESLLPITVLTILHGAGIGLSLPVLLAEVSAVTAKEERGMAVALRMFFNRLGFVIVPASLGLLIARFDMQTAFAVVGCVMVLIMIGAIALQRYAARSPGVATKQEPAAGHRLESHTKRH